ncbi:Rpn family recombination-promoting nuclease/putative transposase [Oscillatoria sp. FACHB-1406]|uniref:Rpn family recombination-promoting nuclease/putative transposase n=1 Tax=Oscillatoria sp. FACHB-1406 TaxID=2692846 RepID=UPI00168707C2|nr:Rpn family recombination-promoting nuclease/putative transposase [Oscillatoria sp. FACHB-1406]MBD2578705.1 PD-(D/E)XK nuclease family transposase [Oscillatoria sp. FACHB-1406]
MNFINPKTDFAFKKIFGSEQSKDILISFLNSILSENRPAIQDLEILDPYQAPRIRGVKDTYLDIKAVLSDNTTVIIEMQVLNVEGFEKRILYNAAKSYSIQLDLGEGYTLLNPVIALTITDFEMFPEISRPISRFVLKERDYLVDYISDDLELVFVELPKFNLELDQLSTLSDKWLYFIKNARLLHEIPANLQEVPELEKAFEIADRVNLSREELEDLEKREIYIHDQRNIIKKALQQGLEQGLEQGREEGRRSSQIAIARQLIGILDKEIISQTTGLSVEEIRSLLNPET